MQIINLHESCKSCCVFVLGEKKNKEKYHQFVVRRINQDSDKDITKTFLFKYIENLTS